MKTTLATWMALAVMASGCVDAAEDEDGADDVNVADGKTDGAADAPYVAAAELRFVNAATLDDLRAIGISSRAAAATVAAQRPFADLLALDAVKYTGTVYFSRLYEHVKAAGLIGRCGDGVLQADAHEECDGGSNCTVQCRSADDFDTSMYAARIEIPSTIFADLYLRSLVDSGYLLMGQTNASAAQPVQLGDQTITDSGVFVARIDDAGHVVYARVLANGFSLAKTGPRVISPTEIQFELGGKVYRLDPATGAATWLGNLPLGLAFVYWTPAGEVVAKKGNVISLFDKESQEPVWSTPCAGRFEYLVSRDAVVCNNDGAVAQTASGYALASNRRIAFYSPTGAAQSAFEDFTHLRGSVVATDIDAKGRRMVEVIDNAGDRPNQRQVRVVDRYMHAQSFDYYFVPNAALGRIPAVASSTNSFAVLDNANFSDNDPDSATRTLMIVRR
ncbi:MAG TPA: hypothetical protein PLF40_15070 [Kofleriaceae bacterium]|nr:hypothetical protein [Kofleriaceae bacterium]